jgi:hypothetical protein
MSLFTPSGGLVYHLRALRYGRTLWAPYRAALAAWLERSLPLADELILVGPSAGHCLPLVRLGAFGRLVVLEPDPLARRLLQLRLPRARLELEPRDLLLGPLLSGAPGLDDVLQRRPRASVLFCNLLGQLHWELPEEQQARFRAEFARRVLPLLSGRSWASFHDRWSVDGAQAPGLATTLHFPRCPSDEELAAACFGPSAAPVTALDHGASQLFPEALPRSYFGWQLTPRALHVVEGVAGGAKVSSAPRRTARPHSRRGSGWPL